MHGREAEVVRRRRGDDDVFTRRQVHQPAFANEGKQLRHRLLRRADDLAALWMILEHVMPDVERWSVRRHLGSGLGELGLDFLQLTLANREQDRGRDVDELLGTITRLDVGGADRVAAGGLRQNGGLELGGVGVDGATSVTRSGRELLLQRRV